MVFVFDYWHENWWEEVLSKATMFGIVPSEALILNAHEVVH